MTRVSKLRRPSGYWCVRYWEGGQAVDESARTKSESAAEQHRLRREMEINAGIQPIRQGDVADLIERYLEVMPPQTSDAHRGEARRILKGFLEICGSKRRDGTSRLQTGKLTPELIDRFIVRRQRYQLHDGSRHDPRGRKVVRRKPISNVTLRKELRYLSGFFNWCCRQRPPYLRENPIPLSNAKSLRNDARPHYMITDAEFRALLKACTDLRQYLLLSWWTGGRRNEIRWLHYYHFDFTAGTLDAHHMKNNSLSVLPIAAPVPCLHQSTASHMPSDACGQVRGVLVHPLGEPPMLFGRPPPADEVELDPEIRLLGDLVDGAAQLGEGEYPGPAALAVAPTFVAGP